MVAWPDALSGNGRMSRLRPRSNGLPSVRGSVQLAHAPRAVCGFVLLLAAALRSAPSRHNEVHLPGPARSGQVKSSQPCQLTMGVRAPRLGQCCGVDVASLLKGRLVVAPSLVCLAL